MWFQIQVKWECEGRSYPFIPSVWSIPEAITFLLWWDKYVGILRFVAFLYYRESCEPYLSLKAFWHQTGSTSCNHIQNKKTKYPFFKGVIWAYFMPVCNPVRTWMFSFLKAMKNSWLILWGVDSHWLCLVIINHPTWVGACHERYSSSVSESWNQERLISHSNKACCCFSPMFWYYR